MKRLDRAGFAQEFLRRNHSYQADYDRAVHRIATGALGEDDAGRFFARRWGLCFPVRSASPRCPIAGFMVPRASS
ncbi:MAG: DUF6499 domain-containing protein [Novosphingobium sp.]